MAKYSTKKDVVRKWTGNIANVKVLYNQARKENPSLPSFYKSTTYKALNQKRKKAVYRYDNKEKISQQRRDAVVRKNKVVKKEKESGIKRIPPTTLFEAFSGKGRIFEQAVIKANDGKTFFGELVFFNEFENPDKPKKTYYFTDFARFKMKLNKMLEKMYNKDGRAKDDYEAFKWQITRMYKADKNSLYIKYELEKFEE